MKESLQLLLLEAQVYKEDIERSFFRLNQFCERLMLTQKDDLKGVAQLIKVNGQSMNATGELLKNAESILGKYINEGEPSEKEAVSVSDEENPETSSVNVPVLEPFGDNAPELMSELQENGSGDAAFEAVGEDDVPAFGEADSPAEEKTPDLREEGASSQAFPPVDSLDDSSFAEYASAVLSELGTDEKINPAQAYVADKADESKEVSSGEINEAQEKKVQCLSCGNMVKETAAFCPKCGCRLSKPVEASEISDSVFAGILEEEEEEERNSFSAFSDFEPEAVVPDDDFMSSYKQIDPYGNDFENAVPLAYLVRLSDNSRLPLNADEFFIGRDPSRVNLCIPGNNAVSRVHAKIFLSGKKYYIADCDSVNGVSVNNQRINPNEIIELYDGCVISISTESFRFVNEK